MLRIINRDSIGWILFRVVKYLCGVGYALQFLGIIPLPKNRTIKFRFRFRNFASHRKS